MGRDIVDQERFERLEEQAREIAGPFGAGIVAGVAPQFLQHEFRARHVLAAQQAALELGHQQSPGVRDCRSLRYCRNRSTRSPSAIRFTHAFTPEDV